MAKPYLLYKRSNGIYYAEILLPDGTRATKKSTGSYNKTEAEKIVMGWIVNGNIPKRINSKDSEKSNVDKISFLNQLRTLAFTFDDIKDIVHILKDRKYLQSATIYNTPSAQSLFDYLVTFWNYDTSPYVREKRLKGQSIHKDYCDAHIAKIKQYWYPIIKDKTIGDLTRKDVNSIFTSDSVSKLAPKTINGIVSSLTIPMKYAFLNELTTLNCYDGIMKCTNKSKKRAVLTLEQAMQLFTVGEWENDSAKLANMLAFYTGMRQGEIAALRVEDIGLDRIYIRHSWSKYEGLKETKTNECREIKIPDILRTDLLNQASFNPFNEGLKAFVFFGLKPGQPTDPGNWRKYLHRALETIGYSNPKEICFHAWRHLWCSRVSDLETDKRIIMTGSGHKTEFMLDHYSDHLETERALDKLEQTTDKIFLPILKKADGIIDADIIPDEEEDNDKKGLKKKGA